VCVFVHSGSCMCVCPSCESGRVGMSGYVCAACTCVVARHITNREQKTARVCVCIKQGACVCCVCVVCVAAHHKQEITCVCVCMCV